MKKTTVSQSNLVEDDNNDFTHIDEQISGLSITNEAYEDEFLKEDPKTPTSKEFIQENAFDEKNEKIVVVSSTNL